MSRPHLLCLPGAYDRTVGRDSLEPSQHSRWDPAGGLSAAEYGEGYPPQVGHSTAV